LGQHKRRYSTRLPQQAQDLRTDEATKGTAAMPLPAYTPHLADVSVGLHGTSKPVTIPGTSRVPTVGDQVTRVVQLLLTPEEPEEPEDHADTLELDAKHAYMGSVGVAALPVCSTSKPSRKGEETTLTPRDTGRSESRPLGARGRGPGHVPTRRTHKPWSAG
jgi:hypothetical protein